MNATTAKATTDTQELVLSGEWQATTREGMLLDVGG